MHSLTALSLMVVFTVVLTALLLTSSVIQPAMTGFTLNKYITRLMLLCMVLSNAPFMSTKAAVIDCLFAKSDSIFCTTCRAHSVDLSFLYVVCCRGWRRVFLETPSRRCLSTFLSSVFRRKDARLMGLNDKASV